MVQRLLLFLLLLFLSMEIKAQIVGPVSSPFASIEENAVSNVAALGDTLWVGPGLNRTIDNNSHWYFPEGADQVTQQNGRVFSLALAPDTVWAGLGYSAQTSEGSVQAGLGFHYSTDGGNSWKYLENPNDNADDTTFVYGGETYQKLPVTAQEQSPPYDIAMQGNTILSANWALGLVRSKDFGDSWQRLILPPQAADSLVPENRYTFTGNGENRYDPRFDQNLLGFSVLIDNNGHVWCGTAGGLNISDNAINAPRANVRWQHIQFNGTQNALLGNWIISINQQPSTGDIWMTNWDSGLDEQEQFGVVRTSDGGQTFDQYLVGQRINDIEFNNGIIYAAGDNGLFVSSDNGGTWTEISQIRSSNTFIKSSAQYFSVAATTDRLWVGTSDGLASTSDNGQTWQITRVNFPLDGRNQYQQNAPSTDAYAYPNPFSPRRHELVRIKYEVQQTGNVRIRLLDFGMNLIRELDSGNFPPGTYEAVWDGTDGSGNQVANGPVFYQIDTPGNTIRGKILVID